MNNTENQKANRLIHEKSPYLLQHAYNTVDWYPWGDEAFEKAKNEDKPIFLSVGYSTCHWCHVMERESFEDEEVARELNRVFVCIKVDREERPDIDNIYMAVCQAMTGSGGWPLTIVMSPDKRPFFAGTYFPKKTSFGRMGVIDLAQRIEMLWKTSRDKINSTADSVMTSLQAMSKVTPGDLPGEEALQGGFAKLEGRFDPDYGGFGYAPKFPSPHNLTFLLRYWKRSGNAKALEMVEKTLLAMARGGVYDHIGFGFHRYSTDREWLLPHFEKMLYDQALLAVTYLEAYQATGKEVYAQTAREIFGYVLRDMTSPQGGFYSAEDADSEGEEGKFYVWETNEIVHILGEADAAIFNAAYNIREDGNFTDETTGKKTGANIPHLRKTYQELAQELSLEPNELKDRLEAMRQKLFAVRKKRIHPHKDDKILTDWNGLMIAALAMGGRILNDENYNKSAKKAAGFILSHLKKDGRLLKRFREDEASLPAHLDDYAFFVWGIIELYETTFDTDFLKEALSLNKTMIKHFWDHDNGSFYFTADDAEDVLVRHRELYDGAVPSGNSVAAMNNLRLGRITGNTELEQIAEKIARAFTDEIEKVPQGYTQMLSAINFMAGPSLEIVIAGEAQAQDTKDMLQKLYSTFVPNKVVVLHPGGKQAKEIEELAPYTRRQQSIEGKATAYVCRNFSCQAPVTDADKMLSLLD
ncbi:thioredoxin domain-containing protein [Dethiobacter alkaliphilus]|uniref:thioredoxin domain-containing protein n=1 Tax=Dethiobacter alkaliphilus TaxID=427926 RepID=UPI002225E7B6|nr:thioredoxin domain-containing protein [Dethiobacter alkaliphilus]MCW3489812.1 thioredoxin domain-containing protein [Dethiobacter alkaliphilus]